MAAGRPRVTRRSDESLAEQRVFAMSYQATLYRGAGLPVCVAANNLTRASS